MLNETPGKESLYTLLGGEARVFELVDRFYDLMDQIPEYAGIRRLHPPSLETSRNKLKWFLSGWLGGPDLYVQRFGHPRLRARHLPFPIGMHERDQWLSCMNEAMDHLQVDEPLKAALQQAFFQTADWMRNKEE